MTAEQRRAVENDACALEIRAGPGTGKTFTLAHRAARIAPGLRAQSRLLVVSFTREACASLDRRLSLLLGRGHGVRVGSFHQWAARELPPEERRFMPEAEARRVVADALGGSAALLGRVLGAGPGGGDDAATRVLGFLSHLKNAQTTLGKALVGTHAHLAPWEQALERVQDAYETKKGERLDYDDLLAAFRDRLKRSPSFRQESAARWDHVMVDEYQDVNAVQAETVRLVTREGPRVTVVGDTRQSIYGFRGGSPRHLEDFLKAYKGQGERVALTRTFRMTRSLAAAANAILTDGPALRSAGGAAEGVPPRLVAHADPHEEARWAADHLASLLAQGAEHTDLVVLVRARHLAAAYQDEVLERRADEAWADQHAPLMDAAVDAFLDAWRATEGKGGPRRIFHHLLDQARGTAHRALRILERRSRASPLPARVGVKDLLALPRSEELFHVPVQTIHAAKGLEWDHVLILGAREGGIPSDHAANAPASVQKELLDEERRLLYVAATRARKTLTITWPEKVDRRERRMGRFLEALVARPTA